MNSFSGPVAWHGLLHETQPQLVPPFIIGALLLCISVFGIMASRTFRPGKAKATTYPLPPIVPAKLAAWNHLLIFLRGNAAMAGAIMPLIGSKTPLRFTPLGMSVSVIHDPTSVRRILHSQQTFTTRFLRAVFVQNVFGMPAKASALIRNDNSGSAREPLPGSNVPDHKRIIRKQQESTFDLLSGTGFVKMLPRYVDFIEVILNDLQTKEWTNYPDIFDFLRHVGFVASINTLCGPELLFLSPDFEESFWTFDHHAHVLHVGISRLFNPAPWAARERCLDAIGKWRQAALRSPKSDVDSGTEGPWDPAWGSKVMRSRNEMYDGFPEFDERARNGADLGFLWSANDNLVPVAAWFVVALLRRTDLLEKCMAEASEARVASDGKSLPRFDNNTLMKQPYIMSSLYEVLRTCVTSMIARNVEKTCEMEGFTIKKDSVALVPTYMTNMDPQTWSNAPGGSSLKYSLNEFWPERFLEFSADAEKPKFSMRGLDGIFLPFGAGRDMCPGRHFATRAIVTITMTLVTAFEFESLSPQGWQQRGENWHMFGYAAFRPVHAIPFRVRRRVIKDPSF